MKQFVVAFYDMIRGRMIIKQVQSETPVKAIKDFLLQICETEEGKQSQMEWNANAPDDLEALLGVIGSIDVPINVIELNSNISQSNSL